MANPCDQLEEIGIGSSEVFGTGLTSLIVSTALATVLTFAGLADTATTTASGSSALLVPIENDLLASATGTTTLTDKLTANSLSVSTALGQTAAFVSADVLAVSTGTASSAITSGKESDAAESAVASSSLFGGALRAPVQINEQAVATSVLLANPENNPVASGAAVSSVIHGLLTSQQCVSTGDATSTLLDNQTPASMADSVAQASSALTDHLVASSSLLSQAQAVSTLLLPSLDQAWVLNSESTAMWRYTDYPLRWAASIKGVVVGLTEAGLCTALPVSDAAWHVDTGWSELGDQHKKRLTYTYVGGSYPADTKLEVGVDLLPAFYTYPLLNTRATIGKGLNARYWRFRFSGKGAATILDIRSDVAVSARRI